METKDNITAYIAGPMSGIKDFNFPAFNEAQERLEELGYNVLNPAKMDIDAGFDPEKDAVTPEIKEAFIRRDIEAVMSVDLIVALPGHTASTGATAELAIARWRGIPILEYPDIVPCIDFIKAY